MQAEAAMGRKLVSALTLAVWILAPLTPALAQQAGGGKGQGRRQALMRQVDRAARWWNRPQIAEQIGVSVEQKARLDAAADEAEKERRAASAEFSAVYTRYLDALSEATVDRAVVDRRRKDVEDASASMMAISLDQLIAVREILTLEQWTSLREIMPGAVRMGQMRARGAGGPSGTPGRPK
jgi:hypothetical protein